MLKWGTVGSLAEAERGYTSRDTGNTVGEEPGGSSGSGGEGTRRHLRSPPVWGPPERADAQVLGSLWGTNLVPPGDPRSHLQTRGKASLRESAAS